MPANRPGPTRRPALSAGLGLLLAVVISTAGCSGQAAPPAPSPSALSHVHGMAVNPADGQLYVATHHGVVRVSDTEAAPVGESRQDTMGFTVIGRDHFLASGHPAPGQSGPAHLGLIESTDGGRTWRTVSLAGQADFHALRSAGGVTYGLDSTSGSLLASTDRRSWETRSTIAAYDLAVDPSRAETVLASTEQGLQRSTDGGRTWRPAGGPPVLLLHWAAPDRLDAVGADGQLLRSTDGGTTWSPTAGRVTDPPAAFTSHGDQLFLATRDARVLRSADAGATWQPMETSLS